MNLVPVLFLAALLTASVHADIYKWVDEEGRTVYSQVAPVSGDVETVTVRHGISSVSQEQAQKRLAEQLEKFQDIREERRLGKEKFEEEKQKKAIAKANCKNARDNLEKLKNISPSVQYQMPDGSFKRITPEERNKMLEENTTFADFWCKE